MDPDPQPSIGAGDGTLIPIPKLSKPKYPKTGITSKKKLEKELKKREGEIRKAWFRRTPQQIQGFVDGDPEMRDMRALKRLIEKAEHDSSDARTKGKGVVAGSDKNEGGSKGLPRVGGKLMSAFKRQG